MTLKQQTQQATLALAHHDYEKGLTSHAFFKVGDHAVSQDLVQDTFMKTWKYLVKGGNIEVMKAFLYHILNNLIIDEYRKRKSTSLDAILEKGFEPSAGDSEHMQNALDGQSALLLIQRLPLPYRNILRMRYIQDLSLKEISDLTGQTRNTIAVQVHRGIEKLKLFV